MPDNPHPHPPEFNQTVQWLLIAFLELLSRRMTSVTLNNVVAPADTKATAFNYMIKPEV